jgi:hypothetical protein
MEGSTVFGELHMIQVPGAVLARFEGTLRLPDRTSTRLVYASTLRVTAVHPSMFHLYPKSTFVF